MTTRSTMKAYLFGVAVLILATAYLARSQGNLSQSLYNTPPALTGNSAPDCQIGPITLSASGAQPAFDNRVCMATMWTLMDYTNSSVAPAITIQLERADDNSGTPATFANWPAPDIETSALGALTNIQNIDFNAGQLTYYRFYPWVRVNLVSLGSNGTVTFQVMGYRPRFGAPTTSAGGTLGTSVCANLGVLKTVAINVSSATTTAIVPVSGTASVYPCGGQITIASSATSAATALFEYGTGTACATPTKTLTGTIGGGIVTASAGTSGIVVPVGPFGPSAFGNGFCIVSAGTTVNIQGWAILGQQ